MKLRARHAAFAVAALGAGLFVACLEDPHRRTTREQAMGGGGACEAPTGQLPPPDCDDSENNCTPTPGCTVDEARCGSTSTCLPIGDNRGKDVQDFRIRRLNIATPAALASSFIQNTVVNLNIDLEQKSCGELGKGLFTWLLRVDRRSSTLTTGGSPPAADPLGQGFCFASFMLGDQRVEPLTTKIAFEGDVFRSIDKRSVKIPIFLSEDLGSAILLPISDVVIDKVTISDEGNCIGGFNAAALDPACREDRSLCSKWRTSGALGGYITLEEADAVVIRDLNNKSLCSYLASASELVCPRDASGRITYRGDYCSETKSPGGCGDSVWLAATFAASAAKIFDGRGAVEGCSGTTDAGGPPADSGSDADASDAQ